MATKTRKNSRILDSVYETACDLHSIGLLNEQEMQSYNELCLGAQIVYLDKDIADYLNETCKTSQSNLQSLVNDLLRKNIEIAKRMV